MRLVPLLMGAAALAGLPSVASAATLFDQINIPPQSNTAVTRAFTAGGTTTTLDFAGYNPPSWTYANDILLTLTGSTSNLLGATWLFTPAPSGSDAHQGPTGTYGTNDLAFGGLTTGSYDTYSQTVNTIAGDSYTLSFLLSSSSTNNGLRVTASNAVGGVPEPATWAMMLLGFGATGFAVRGCGKRRQARRFA